MSFEEHTDTAEAAVAQDVPEVEEQDSPDVRHDADGAGHHEGDRRRARLMRGVVTPTLGLLAVAAIVLGVLNATIWKPSRVITATAQIADERYVVTDANVEGLVSEHVKVEVHAKHSDTVCVALASSKDATGWLGDDAYARLTGLSDWTTLSVQKVASRGHASQDADDVSFRDSDMWRSVTCGKGTVSLETQERNATDVVLVDFGKVTDGEVSFRWIRKVLPDFAMPLYFVGGLLAVAAVLAASVFAMPPSRRRKRVRTSEPAVESAQQVTIGEAVAGSLTGFISSVRRGPKRSRRRHAAGSAVAADGASQPVVVDPASRNLVEDAAGQEQSETTAVITPEELQAYFNRLAQEIGEDSAADATGGTPDDTDSHESSEGKES